MSQIAFFRGKKENPYSCIVFNCHVSPLVYCKLEQFFGLFMFFMTLHF